MIHFKSTAATPYEACESIWLSRIVIADCHLGRLLAITTMLYTCTKVLPIVQVATIRPPDVCDIGTKLLAAHNNQIVQQMFIRIIQNPPTTSWIMHSTLPYPRYVYLFLFDFVWILPVSNERLALPLFTSDIINRHPPDGVYAACFGFFSSHFVFATIHKSSNISKWGWGDIGYILIIIVI